MKLFEPRKGSLPGNWTSIVLLVSLATASIVREPSDSLQHIGEVIEDPVTSPTHRQHQLPSLNAHKTQPDEREVETTSPTHDVHEANHDVLGRSRGYHGGYQKPEVQSKAGLRDDQHDFPQHGVHNVLWGNRNQKKWDQVNLLTIQNLLNFDVVKLEDLSCANFVQRFLLKGLLINSTDGGAKRNDLLTMYDTLRGMLASTDSETRQMIPKSVRVLESSIEESRARLEKLEITSDDKLEFQRLLECLVKTLCAEQMIRSFFRTSGRRKFVGRGPTAKYNKIAIDSMTRGETSLELYGHHYASYMNIVDTTKRVLVESIDDFWCWDPKKKKDVPKPNPIGSIDKNGLPINLLFKTDRHINQVVAGNFFLPPLEQAFIKELARNNHLASLDTLLLWENLRQIRNLKPGPEKVKAEVSEELGRYPSKLKEVMDEDEDVKDLAVLHILRILKLADQVSPYRPTARLFTSMSHHVLKSLEGYQGLKAETLVDAFQHLLMFYRYLQVLEPIFMNLVGPEIRCSKGYFPMYLWKLWKKKTGTMTRLEDSWSYRNFEILEIGESFAEYIKSFKQINLIQGQISHYSQHTWLNPILAEGRHHGI